MRRNRYFLLLTRLCLVVLLAGMTAPVFAGPAADPPASAGSLWRALTAWLDGLGAANASSELNIGPYPDPAGHTGTTSASGEANLIPYPDPDGHTATSSNGEANLIPLADPQG